MRQHEAHIEPGLQRQCRHQRLEIPAVGAQAMQNENTGISGAALRLDNQFTGKVHRDFLLHSFCSYKCCTRKKARISGPFVATEVAHQFMVSRSLADDLDVGSLEAFLALGDVEGNLLAVLQSLEAVSLNLGEMCEQIVAIVVRRDEAEAFGVVEPLDSTSSHYRNSSNSIDFSGRYPSCSG